ncbi:MAG TPA: hypothetical protein DCR93_03720, partial [Cytophagales bacterium]|nr:hypothetical protein [Cytophagales bacterium]
VLSRVLVTLSDHPVCAQLAEVQQWVAEAGQEARRLAHGMLPGVLQRLGLVAGLGAFVEGLQKAAGPELVYAPG